MIAIRACDLELVQSGWRISTEQVCLNLADAFEIVNRASGLWWRCGVEFR